MVTNVERKLQEVFNVKASFQNTIGPSITEIDWKSNTSCRRSSGLGLTIANKLTIKGFLECLEYYDEL